MDWTLNRCNSKSTAQEQITWKHQKLMPIFLMFNYVSNHWCVPNIFWTFKHLNHSGFQHRHTRSRATPTLAGSATRLNRAAMSFVSLYKYMYCGINTKSKIHNNEINGIIPHRQAAATPSMWIINNKLSPIRTCSHQWSRFAFLLSFRPAWNPHLIFIQAEDEDKTVIPSLNIVPKI